MGGLHTLVLVELLLAVTSPDTPTLKVVVSVTTATF
jgi:hypothetical protein